VDRPVIDTMRAVRLLDWESRPELVTVPIPQPAAGQVLLEVEAAGICHSDLHLMRTPGGLPGFEIPFTLGHESAGVVVQTGPGVTGYRNGDKVAVFGIWSCGRCSRCLAGRENYCTKRAGAVGGGLGYDGGLADYLLVPDARFLVPLDGLDPVVAALMTDAGLTSYHAIGRSRDRLHAGSVVVVIGVGGLGHLAVQILRATSAATVVAVDAKDSARELALRCGAHEVAAEAGEARRVVKRLSDDVGADVVLDFVGADSTLRLASQLVAIDGDLTIVGSAGGLVTAGKTSGLPVACRVSAPFWGTRAELAEVLQLARQGLITPVVERATLRQAVAVYERLETGEILGRAVVVPE
jgi:alcohol dehydrogenase, propanol-preferring